MKIFRGRQVALVIVLIPAAFGNVMTPRIIGGIDAVDGRYSYAQISLQFDGSHVCGASLVSSDMVLTAAHCQDGFDTIVVNAYNLSDTSETVEIFNPRVLLIHPDYSSETDAFDAMLIKLDGTVSLMDPVKHINNRADVPSESDTLTVVGWGVTQFGDYSSSPDIFQEVEITYMANSDCKIVTNEDGQSYGEWITKDHLCAWQEGKDSCYGDSGSPLIKRGKSDEEDVQVGIVSWGVDCAGPLPGVYSRLSFMYEWVRESICTYSDTSPRYMECNPQLLPTENGTKEVTAPLFSGDEEDEEDGAIGVNEDGASEMQQGDPSKSSHAARCNGLFFQSLVLLLSVLIRS